MSHEMYKNDNNDTFISHYVPLVGVSNGNYWGRELLRMGYTSTPAAFDCPTLRPDSSINWSTLTDVAFESQSQLNPFYWTDFGYNYNFIGSSQRVPGATQPNRPARGSDLHVPSTTIVQADSIYTPLLPAPRGVYIIVDHGNGGVGNLAHARHSGGVGVLWADSHVSVVGVGDASSPYHTGLTNFYDLKNFWTRTGKTTQ